MINIDMACAVVIENDIYFSALDFNALLRMDLLSGEIEYICKFEREKGECRLHIKAFQYENKIWFIPLFGEFITCFYINEKKMEYIEIPKKKIGILGKDIFWLHINMNSVRPQFFDAGKINEEMIYLIPSTSDAVIILNMRTGSIKPFYHVVNVEKELIGCGTICSDKLWMAPYIGNQLICLDTKSGEVERVEFYNDLGYYFGMCSFENRIWFSSKGKNSILVYDTLIKKFERINIEDNCLKNESQTINNIYRDIFCFNENIWMLPANAENIVCINPQNLSIIKIYPTRENSFGILFNMQECRDKLFAFSYNCVIGIDTNKKITMLKKIYIDETTFQKSCEINSLVEYYNQSMEGIPEEKIGLFNYLKAVVK